MGNAQSKKEKYIRAVNFKGDGAIPCRVVINGSVWDEEPEFFEELKKTFPHVEVAADHNPEREKEHFSKDAWGCLWHYPGKYLDGQVVEHPLKNWSCFKNYQSPDPESYADWAKEKEKIEREKREGKIAVGDVEHGFFYLKLTYLRGFNNLMLDVAERRKELKELIYIITKYWCGVVKRWLDLGVDVVNFGDDLGHQNTLPISPSSWRELIKPSYQKIFSLCRENGAEVYLHTDGYILDIIPDLIETGITILNPQDMVNGLGNLKKLTKRKTCIDLDIDRQNITAFGKPGDIDRHILNCTKTLGSPRGGLMLVYGAYSGTPKENIAQVIRSMEKYYDWWVK